MMGNVGRMRGWPVTLTEPSLLAAAVGLRPIRVKDATAWRDARVRNASLAAALGADQSRDAAVPHDARPVRGDGQDDAPRGAPGPDAAVGGHL